MLYASTNDGRKSKWRTIARLPDCAGQTAGAVFALAPDEKMEDAPKLL